MKEKQRLHLSFRNPTRECSEIREDAPRFDAAFAHRGMAGNREMNYRTKHTRRFDDLGLKHVYAVSSEDEDLEKNLAMIDPTLSLYGEKTDSHNVSFCGGIAPNGQVFLSLKFYDS